MMPAAAKILIVDDQPLAIEVLRNALVDLGQFHVAVSGAEALALVAKEPVDLILMDGRMPSMDGYATCRLLQREFPEIPVIIVTIVKDDVSEVRALDAGAVDFITKPINPVVVRARVATHLKLKAQRDRLRSLGSRDPLTGIPNRRALEERLAGEWRRSQRHGLSLSLIMIDIDHFKAYNDHCALAGYPPGPRAAGALCEHQHGRRHEPAPIPAPGTRLIPGQAQAVVRGLRLATGHRSH